MEEKKLGVARAISGKYDSSELGEQDFERRVPCRTGRLREQGGIIRKEDIKDNIKFFHVAQDFSGP